MAAAASGPQVLFLDFDGGSVTSNPCGFSYSTPYQAADFSLTALGFGGQEQTAKDYILQFVQEDYAAYHVTITTTQPASGAYSTIYLDDFSFEGFGVLGVACYDVGNSNRNDFGFVFVRELGAYASGNDLLTFSQYVANVVSHEAGHLFGLDHVNGASLMSSFLPYDPVQLGFGPGANEDSQAELATNLGYAGGVADDFGDTSASAGTLALDASAQGLLERRDDTDAFTLVSNVTQQVTLDLDTTQFGNLDSILTVRDANGTVLASNDNAGGSPDSRIVLDAEAGQTYTVTVSSAGGASSGTYTLHAITANGGSPAISVSDEVGAADDRTLPFGAQVVGSTTQHSFTVSNTGGGILVIDGLRIVGDSEFGLDSTSNPGDGSDTIVIAAGQSHTFVVTYVPSASETNTAQIEILSNDADEPVLTLDLSGFGGYPAAILTEIDGVNDGELAIGDVRATQGSTVSVMTFSNTGSAPLHLTLGLEGSGPFDLFSSELTIAPGGSQTISVQVHPDTATSFLDTLTIGTDDPSLPATVVQLTGRAYMEVGGREKASFPGADGVVTVSLKGAGTGRVFLDDALGTIAELALRSTDAATRIKIAGTATLLDVHSDGALKSFAATSTDLSGGTMSFAGGVAKLSLANVTHSTITGIEFGKVGIAVDMLDSVLRSESSDGVSPTGIASLTVGGTYAGSTVVAGVDVASLAAHVVSASGGGSGNIGKVSLTFVPFDNGEVEFGVFSNGSIGSVKVNSARVSLPFISDDFVVAVLS